MRGHQTAESRSEQGAIFPFSSMLFADTVVNYLPRDTREDGGTVTKYW